MNTAKNNQKRQGATRVNLFGLPLDIHVDAPVVIERLASGNTLLTYLNPYAFSLARKCPQYAENLAQFDLVVCDGIGIQKAAKRFFRVDSPILTPDMSGIGRDYLAHAASGGLSMCLVGGKPGVAAAAGVEIMKHFADIRAVKAFDGFGDSPERARDHILQSSSEMVLAGMGMGLQEEFVLSLRQSGWRGIGICVGGFLDKLANPALDYPEWSKRIGLRFIGRLVNEPRRMIKRYFWDYRFFISQYLRASLHFRNTNIQR